MFSTVEFIRQNKISSRGDFFGDSDLMEISMAWIQNNQ